MASPSVSVIVPMYKVERYIKSCINSILAQTFQDFEIILVDDASPDACAEICQKFYGGNDKVRLIRHEKNLGLGPARNTGMKHAVGKYIYFVDSDDLVLPNALEKFFTTAENTNAQVVHAAGRYELTQEEPLPIRQENLKLKWDNYNREGFLPNNVIYRLEEHWQKYSTWSTAWLCFCRRDFLEQNRIEFLNIISEDEPFSFALFCAAERYYILHEALYIHRKRDGSIMRSNDTKRLSDGIYAMIVGAAYIERILDFVPRFDGYDLWRDKLLETFFNRFSNNHTAPFYKELNISPETDALVEKSLSPAFGQNSSFVKYLFNGFHISRRQAEILLQQRNQLIGQNRTLRQQSQRSNDLLSTFLREQGTLLKIIDGLKNADRRILLFGTPEHSNLGDHAIISGELRVLKKFFPEHEVVEIPYDYLTGELGELLFGLGLQKYIRRDDVIFLHGGGNLGNLWIGNEILRRLVMEKFPDNKIVIFPQSICFTDDDAGHAELARSQKIYNAHKDLHLMTRDENSFNLAKKFFPAVKNYLLPDTATVLQGIVDDVDIAREGVLFVLRRDKEKVRDDATITQIQDYLTAKNIPFEVTDTAIGDKVTAQDREQKIRDMLTKFRRSKLIITDRFHGMIFSFVTRTPVLAFKSFDTKISSGIKWFRNFPSIFYAEAQDRSSIENFIDENYFAAEEKFSDALNVKSDADSEEKFFRALNRIMNTNVAVKQPNRLTVDAVNISGRRIVYEYSVEGDWKKFFNRDAKFFIEYSEDISRVPKDIAVIPFLCNVLPIAWVSDAQIVVPELDYDFYSHLAEIKKGYVDMYPRINFGGRLSVGNLVSHDYEVGSQTAVFFSGGADSFDTLIAHAEEHPALITLLGSDIKLSDVEGQQVVINHARETARQFQCKNLFVASSFRLFLNEGALSNFVMPLANDGWWHGFQHGIGLIGHAAPYVYLHKLGRIYIASSFTKRFKYTCASDPTIDNHVHIGKCVTVHDGYEFSRQDKIRRICEFRRRTGIPIRLRVCWKSSGGQNCCACGKCYRAICSILAEGENPAEMGFTAYSPETLKKLHQEFEQSTLAPDILARRWLVIQERFRERPENLPKELAWLSEIKF